MKALGRAERLENIIRALGGSASLGEILRAAQGRGDFGLMHRFTAATSELRQDLLKRTPMETLVWAAGDTPSQGTYTIFPARMDHGVPVAAPRQLQFGQTAHF